MLVLQHSIELLTASDMIGHFVGKHLDLGKKFLTLRWLSLQALGKDDSQQIWLLRSKCPAYHSGIGACRAGGEDMISLSAMTSVFFVLRCL